MLQASIPQWRSRPIFISSTFRDMQAERDHLRNFVFPKLEEQLRKRRQHLEPIDLRQGVQTNEATSEEEREQLVLKVCLDEIRRSRPFLIVLLGDRYGWVPPEERMAAAMREVGFHATVTRKSVTAFEIEYGVFAEDSPFKRRCLIYCRQPLPYDAMPEELRGTYSEQFSQDEEAPARSAALASLKQRLRSDPDVSPRLHTYEAAWDAKNRTVAGLEEWGNLVFEDLWRELDEDTSSFAAKRAARWEETERAALAEFVEQRSRTFTGREEIVRQLLALSRSPISEAASWGACITGTPGAGKSALFARLTRELDAGPDLFVLANAAGATQLGSSVDAVLRRWIYQLSELLGVADPLSTGAPTEQVDETFFSLLRRCSDDMRVVVLLDALDQFEPTPRARYLTWLTNEKWPRNARLIATAAPGPEADVLAQRSGITEISLPPLTFDTARDLATGVLFRYHVPWSDVVWQALAAKRLKDGHLAVGNPLWTTVACEQLALLDADDFDDSDRRYVVERDPQARLVHLRRDLTERMPPDVPGLYGWQLARIEKVHGAGWSRAFAVAIALSRHGWREQDLRELVPKLAAALFSQVSVSEIDPLKLAELRRAFRAHLTVRGETQQWDFSHAQMHESVYDQFLHAPSEVRAAHAIIADHLHSLYQDDPLRRTELMAHLLAANDIERAAEHYSDEHTTGEVQASAALALVEHVLTDESPTAANPHEPASRLRKLITRVLALLEAPGLPDDNRALLCARMLHGFLDALQSTAPLTLVTQLTSVIVHHCHVILSRQGRGSRYHGMLAQGEQRLAHYLYELGHLAAAVEHSDIALAMSRDYFREHATSRIGVLRLADALGGRARLHRLLGEPHKSNLLLQQAESLVIGYREPDIGSPGPTPERVIDPAEIWRIFAPDRTDADRAVVDGLAERAVLELEAGNVQRARELYDEAIALNDRLSALARKSRDFHETVWANYQKLRGERDSEPDDSLLTPTGCASALDRAHHFLNALDLAEVRDGLLEPARRLVMVLDRAHAFLHRQAGYVESNHGDPEAAAAHFESALKIAAELQAKDPLNAQLKTDLMYSYGGMGAAQLAGREHDTAADFYGRALTLSEELYRRYPDNAMRGHDHAANLISLGQVSQQRGDLSSASEYFQQALALIDDLRRRFPENRPLEEVYLNARVRYVTVREALEHRSRPVDLAARLRHGLTNKGNGGKDGP